MSLLFPTENRTIEDFARLSARLRDAMGPHVVDILRHDLSVVLDFPANTVRWRSWMRSLIDEADVADELHVLDVPDAIWKQRLRQRNAEGEHPYEVSEETYELFMSYFVPPGPDEGFDIVSSTRSDRQSCRLMVDRDISRQSSNSVLSGRSGHLASRAYTTGFMSTRPNSKVSSLT